MAANTPVLIEHGETVWTVTIDRPERRNALDDATIDALRAAIAEAEAADGVGGVVLTGAGSRAFCAGSDLKALAGMSREEAVRHTRNGQLLMDAIESSSVVTVAAVEGFALGGGFELALACDLIVAARQATFGLPELKNGMVPAWGGTFRLSRAIGLNLARQIILSGRVLDAPTAQSLGLTLMTTEEGVSATAARDVLAGYIEGVDTGTLGIVKQLLLSGSFVDRASASLAERLTETMLTHAADYGVKRP